MRILAKLGAAILGAATIAAAPASQAATCSTAELTFSTSCEADVPGGPGGNVSATQMNGFNGGAGVFGLAGWTDLGKVETTRSGGTFSSDFFTITSNQGNASGSWSLNPEYKFAAGAAYSFVLKGGRDNVAYRLDTSTTSGIWTNFDLFTPNGRNNAGLSNMTLFGAASPAPVPLPAAAWLLIGGIAGLGAMARMRKAVATAR